MSIVTHVAFAERGRLTEDNKKALVSERQQMINALKKANQDIEEKALTIQEIKRQLKENQIVLDKSKTARKYITLSAAFAYFLASTPQAKGLKSAANLTKVISASGGAIIFLGTSAVIEVKKDRIEDLTIMLTKKEEAMLTEHKINTAVLENASEQ